MRISGNKAAFYNSKFIGFQDTLCDDKGSHFFKDCHIEGTVDFIFGSGKSLYLVILTLNHIACKTHYYFVRGRNTKRVIWWAEY